MKNQSYFFITPPLSVYNMTHLTPMVVNPIFSSTGADHLLLMLSERSVSLRTSSEWQHLQAHTPYLHPFAMWATSSALSPPLCSTLSLLPICQWQRSLLSITAQPNARNSAQLCFCWPRASLPSSDTTACSTSTQDGFGVWFFVRKLHKQ